MKPILFVESHRDIVGGGQISLLSLMEHLDRSQYKPLCVCPPGGTTARSIANASISLHATEFVSIRLLSVIQCIRCILRLLDLIRKEDAALIHANGSRSMFYAGFAGAIARVPVVWHVRVTGSDGWLDVLLSRLATRIVVISGAMRERFAKLRVDAKVTVVYNGVDLGPYGCLNGSGMRRELGFGKVPLVGMIAQLIPWKRYEDFIDGMASVAPKHPDARFLLVGEDRDPEGRYLASLKERVARLAMEERFEFMGFRTDIARVMGMLDVVVLSSDNEPFGRVLIEAMAASRPVVATEGGGVSEIVEDGKTGILVPLRDAQALARAVDSLLGEPERAHEMGTAGRRRVEAHFSIQTHVSRIEDLYHLILQPEKR